MHKNFARHNFKTLAKCLTTAIGLLASLNAQAHLTYTGRNLGAFDGLSLASASITNQAVSGNYGWADAADGILGDSHKARAFRFRLDNPANISFSVSANPSATTNSISGLVPGFSIYTGLAAVAPFILPQTGADHDGSLAAQAWRTEWAQTNLGPAFDYTVTDGGWDALHDWKIGGDGDAPGDFSQLSSFTYLGHAVDDDWNGTAWGSFLLGAGDYTILIGGMDMANKGSGTASSPFGLSAMLGVMPVPEPSASVLLALGVGGLIIVARRRN